MKYLTFLFLFFTSLSAEINEQKFIQFCQETIDESSHEITHYGKEMSEHLHFFHYNRMMQMHYILKLVDTGYFKAD